MPNIHFIWVGKLKQPHWRDAAAHYQKALGRHYTLRETVVKDGPGSLSIQDRNEREGEKILAALQPPDYGVALDERGTARSSVSLAKFLNTIIETPGATPCFIIGGAYGLAPAVKEQCRQTLSLGPMTFPHEMARVILLEQLYRAASILKGLPYHHQ